MLVITTIGYKYLYFNSGFVSRIQCKITNPSVICSFFPPTYLFDDKVLVDLKKKQLELSDYQV